MNVLILHGILGKAGENWSQWLCDELESKNYNVIMPNLPEADHPDRTTWLQVVSDLMGRLGDETIIVAHSLGVATALDYLESKTGKIKGLVSVSGFGDDYGMELNSYFMREKAIDYSKVNDSVTNKYVFYGDDDPYVPQDSLKLLADELRVTPTIVEKGGHLNEAAGFNKFPQLLDSVTEI